MRLQLSVLCEYGHHLLPDGAGGPGENLPAALRGGGSYQRPLTVVCLRHTGAVVIHVNLTGAPPQTAAEKDVCFNRYSQKQQALIIVYCHQ